MKIKTFYIKVFILNLLIIGLEPILFKKNQILSLTCLPISPNEQKFNINIPQFDLLTLGAQLFGLLISLYFFYYYSISTSIGNFIEIKKFRTKKINKNTSLVTTIDKDLEYNLWLISYSYIKFIK